MKIERLGSASLSGTRAPYRGGFSLPVTCGFPTSPPPLPALPDLPPLIRCDRLAATLTATSCAARYRLAEEPARLLDPADPYNRCRRCPTGAIQAGEPLLDANPLYHARLCIRCRGQASRLIGGELCPSCYNRQREWLIGRNAKGTRPTMAPLQPRRLHFLADGQPQDRLVPRTADTIEAVVAVMRSVAGAIVIGFQGRRPWQQLGLGF